MMWESLSPSFNCTTWNFYKWKNRSCNANSSFSMDLCFTEEHCEWKLLTLFQYCCSFRFQIEFAAEFFKKKFIKAPWKLKRYYNKLFSPFDLPVEIEKYYWLVGQNKNDLLTQLSVIFIFSFSFYLFISFFHL